MQLPNKGLIFYSLIVLAGILGAVSFSRIAADPAPDFTISDHGAYVLQSYGEGSLAQGYGSVLPGGSTTQPGVAILGLRQNGVLVSETGVPAVPAFASGRIYAEVGGAVDTGLAIANPNKSTATMTFYFTDANGNPAGSGSTTIPGNTQIAKFLDQAPFKVYTTATFQGTFTFSSNVPLAAIALRGFTNERSEFLMSTLPVIDLSLPAGTGTAVIPHFADGGGWTTQVLLVNPSDNPMSGNVQFIGQDGTSTNLLLGYSIPGRTSQKLTASGAGPTTLTGSIQVKPANNGPVPTPLVIFSYRPAGITVSEAGVPVNSGSAFRMFVEASGVAGQSGSIRSGIAVANLSSSPATLTFTLTNLQGTTPPGSVPVSVTLPGAGQTAKLVDELFPMLNGSFVFQGELRITTTSSAGISVVGLQTLTNERSDFLITTMPAANENQTPTTTPVYFPQVVDGGGYTTRFILFSGISSQASGGILRLYKSDSTPLDLNLTGAPLPSSPWTPEGIRMTDISSGFPGGGNAVNPSAFQLKDGRWRVLVSVGGSIRSAISPDGLALTLESGVLIADASSCGHDRAVRLDNGDIRVFCRNTTGIVSFISHDEGLTLTQEAGIRIPNSAVANASFLSTGGIVQTKDGRWRMYFSDENFAVPMRIFSAVSVDQLAWTVEPGVRIGAGVTASGTGHHPSAIVNPDGSVSVFYTRYCLPQLQANCVPETSSAVWVATAADGLTFSTDVSTGLTPGADPDIVRVGNSLRLYYDWGNNYGTTIASAISLTGAVAP